MAARDDVLSADFQEAVSRYLPFILEIRKRVFFIAAIFLAFSILGFIFYEKLIGIVIKIFSLDGVNIVFTSPFQFFTLAINTGVLLGLVVILPLIIYQIVAFLKPALHPREHKLIAYLIPFSLLLFTSGFIFGILIMRYVLIVFHEKTVALNIGNYLDIGTLVSQVMTTSVLMGLAFEFPIVLTLLMRLGIVKYKYVAGKRIIAYIISFLFAALLPPTDVLTTALLTLPLIVLFELTLIANKFVVKEKLAL